MKIAFINNFYNSGGSTQTSYALAAELYSNNQMSFYGFWDGPYRDKFQKLGKANLLKTSKICDGTLEFEYGDDLIEMLEKEDPDIIHIFLPGFQNPKYLPKLPQKAKKFVTVLCEQEIIFDPNFFDKVFFLSKHQIKFCKNPENSICVRPSIELDFSEKPQSKNPVLARVSAFCPSKLIDHTMQCAFNSMSSKWVIAGEIQSADTYNQIMRIKESNKLTNVGIVANINENLKRKIINNCDIWHYPTSAEVFCFSILEAFAARKPVLSYKNAAIPELFDSDEWLADDIDDLIEKTARLIRTHPSERDLIGKNNYGLYLKNSQQIFANNILSEYKKAMSRTQSAQLL